MKPLRLASTSAFLLLLQIGCSETSSLEVAPASWLRSDASVTADGADVTLIETTDLPPAVADGLQFMREEEKLARDIYKALADKWKLRQFSNIALSEQRHMDALRTVLVRYALKDPTENNGIGVFVNSSLQSLYRQLLDKGLQSVTDAYQVGKLIEETDIADLDQHIRELTTESDIRRVYSNLRQGSLQHLGVFERYLR